MLTVDWWAVVAWVQQRSSYYKSKGIILAVAQQWNCSPFLMCWLPEKSKRHRSRMIIILISTGFAKRFWGLWPKSDCQPRESTVDFWFPTPIVEGCFENSNQLLRWGWVKYYWKFNFETGIEINLRVHLKLLLWNFLNVSVQRCGLPVLRARQYGYCLSLIK